MAALPIAEAWDDARQFIARERSLLLPVGLATYGVGALLHLLILPDASSKAPVTVGPWMLWLIPVILIVSTGHLAVSRIALRPGNSIEESFMAAFRLLPRALGVFIAVGIAIGLIGSILALLGGGLTLMLGLGAANARVMATASVIVLGFWAMVRIALLWPILADRECRAVQAITFSLAVTRGHAFGLAGLLVTSIIVYQLLAVALKLAGGSLLMLFANLVGRPALAAVLEAVLLAGFEALFWTAWTVFAARLYVRMTR